MNRKSHPLILGLPAALVFGAGAVVGTGSLRRGRQLLGRRSDLVVEGIRGNVDTRLGRLDQGRYDAIVLAAAGLERLGLANEPSAVL